MSPPLPPAGQLQQQPLTPEQELQRATIMRAAQLGAVKSALPSLPLTLSQRIGIDFAKCTLYEKRPDERPTFDKKGEPYLDKFEQPIMEPTGETLHVITVDGEEVILLTENEDELNPDLPSELDMFLPIWNATEKIAASHYFAELIAMADMIPDPEEETPVQEIANQ